MSNSKIVALIDYGMGNLHSAAKALQVVSPTTKVEVTSDPKLIAQADHIVLPGVGAIRDCMAEIKRLEIDQVVAEHIRNKPFLGICVGMQTLMASSEENGGVECLGHFDQPVKFFGKDLEDQDGQTLKVPHMGWNQVSQTSHPLWNGIENNSRFYFVHSFYVPSANSNVTVGECNYGVNFAAAVAQDNVFAVQFHPEKSHKVGLQLLKNFLEWDGSLS